MAEKTYLYDGEKVLGSFNSVPSDGNLLGIQCAITRETIRQGIEWSQEAEQKQETYSPEQLLGAHIQDINSLTKHLR